MTQAELLKKLLESYQVIGRCEGQCDLALTWNDPDGIILGLREVLRNERVRAKKLLAQLEVYDRGKP